jgi:hypothetical protein
MPKNKKEGAIKMLELEAGSTEWVIEELKEALTEADNPAREREFHGELIDLLGALLIWSHSKPGRDATILWSLRQTLRGREPHPKQTPHFDSVARSELLTKRM